MDFASFIIAIITSGAFGAGLTELFRRKRTSAEIANLQADLILKVQESLREAISAYECRIERYEARIKALEEESEKKDETIEKLEDRVRDLDRLFESVLAGAWTLYNQIKADGGNPLFTPPKQ